MELSAYSEGKRSSHKITLIYALFGCLWILFSDQILAAFVSDAIAVTAIQTYKGWFYVLVTAVLVYVLVSKLESRLCQLLNQLDQKNRNLHGEMQVRIENEKHIKQLMSDLESKNKELETIIYVSSHDLRSPLINILGFTGELAQSLQRLEALIANCPQAGQDDEVLRLLREEMPDSMQFIKSSADKLDLLQRGLLDICRLGYEPVTLQTVDANDLFRSVIQSLKYQVDQCQAKIVLEDLPACRADEGKLIQVFTNLIGNALKYRDPERPVEITITGSENGETVTYRVSDNGIGIAPKYQDQIFEMFHQLDPSCEGQGMGLTIVKRIIDRMDGNVALQSENGKGVVFSVTLPAE